MILPISVTNCANRAGFLYESSRKEGLEGLRPSLWIWSIWTATDFGGPRRGGERGARSEIWAGEVREVGM